MPKIYNPSNVPPPQAPSYSHAAEVGPGERLLYIAGQVGADADGNVPEGIEAQARLVYRHIFGILEDAGMGPENLVKLTTFMTDPDDSEAMRAVRTEVFGAVAPPNTLVYISRLASPAFLIEVEAVAAG